QTAAAAPVAATGAAAALAAINAAPAKNEAKADAGQALYDQTCQACHAAGLAGAPKFGDKAAWAPRIAQGLNTLVDHAIHGKNAMPPRGGSTASDADIKLAVSYMVNAAK
ncbi:MAG TPA: c-type cytochrome, partial [Methylibium sp.]